MREAGDIENKGLEVEGRATQTAPRALSASISETLASSEISVQWRARRSGRNEHFGQLGK